jgi:dolichol-phosphate mannosyltransferase
MVFENLAYNRRRGSSTLGSAAEHVAFGGMAKGEKERQAVASIAYSREEVKPGEESSARTETSLQFPTLFVVPAFNEEANLPRLLDDLTARPQLFHRDSRVIVVDDGSDDGTAEVVEQYCSPFQIEVVKLGTNQGPGAAFRAGFASALDRSSEEALIVTLEADTTSDLDALPEMIAHAHDGADLVLASVHAGGRMVNVGFLRRVLSAGAGWVVRRSLGVEARTVSSFFRVYRASILRLGVERYGSELIREPGFACKAELLGKLARLGARVHEVPVELDGSRRVGQSKMKVLPTLRAYVRLLWRRRLGKDAVPA